jgi:hypothetical protein
MTEREHIGARLRLQVLRSTTLRKKAHLQRQNLNGHHQLPFFMTEREHIGALLRLLVSRMKSLPLRLPRHHHLTDTMANGNGVTLG